MKTEGKIPFLIVAAFAWIVIVSSCANVGMPEGGPRDTIPPVLLNTVPGYKSVNYKGDEVKITFNEFINTDAISEALVISPPMIKKPLIRTKSKTLVIEFNENLKDSTTYSLDFKSSVADNNEKNPIEDFRFSFSTGNIYDSLKIAGTLAAAFNLKPIENGLVLLHSNLHDSAVFRVRPSYIAKTNKDGQFLIDNIAPGKYHLFSLNDANNNLLYDEGADEIAFYDSLIVPTSEFISEVDTIKTATDTIVVFGHTHFYPEDVMLQQFTEDLFNQYLESYERDSRFKCTFVFAESVKDSFGLRLLNTKPIENWYLKEYTETMDSLIIWIADTTAAKLDTLIAEVSYFQLDSLEKVFVKNDTLLLTFRDMEKEQLQKKKKTKDGKEEIPEPKEQFTWKTSLTGSTVELNKKLGLIAPEPVFTFDSTLILLYHTEDTLKTPLKFKFEKDTVEWRRYNIDFPWQPATGYSIAVDSAAAINIFGFSSKKFNLKFTTREEDFYGSVTLNLTGVNEQIILQLLTNNDDEKVVEKRITDKNGQVLFDYLLPEKYRVKVIYDRNKNGKWDTGSFQDKSQPERVMYINQVHKVRSNWEETLNWYLTPDDKFIKKIRDLEEEEKKRKEAEEKAKKEHEDGDRQERQNFIQGSGSGTGSGIFR